MKALKGVKNEFLYLHHYAGLYALAAKELQEQLKTPCEETNSGTLVLDFGKFLSDFPKNGKIALLEIGILERGYLFSETKIQISRQEARAALAKAGKFLKKEPLKGGGAPNWEWQCRYQLYHPTKARHRRASVGEIIKIEEAGYKLFPPKEIISRMENYYKWFNWDFTPGVPGKVQQVLDF